MFNFFNKTPKTESDKTEDKQELETFSNQFHTINSSPQLIYLPGYASDSLVQTLPADPLGIDVILNCVSIRSDIIASLPIRVYQTRNDSRVEIDHPIMEVFDIPNNFQTSYDFISYVQKSLDLHGNAYIQKIFNGRGDIVSMIPLNPEGMTINLSKDGSYLIYVYDDVPLSNEEIVHIKNIGDNIYVGDSTISLLTNTTQTYAYAQNNIRNSHKFGPSVKGIIESPPKRGDKKDQLEEDLRTRYSQQKAGGVMVLPGGHTWKNIGLSPQDAQTLETMNFSLNRICSVFRLPPAWVYSSTVRPSYSSNEANTKDFIDHAIRPICKRYEAAFNRYLLSPRDRRNGIKIKFDFNSMLRANTAERYASYQIAVNNGILSPNEIRSLEGRGPIEGGDRPFKPMNMDYLGDITPPNNPTSPTASNEPTGSNQPSGSNN